MPKGATGEKPAAVTMAEIFGRGGLLARSHPGYEYRPSQLQMAEIVEEVEAGNPVRAVGGRERVDRVGVEGPHLAERGLPPEGAAFGYSHGHQLWIRTAPHGISAAHAAGRLYEGGIRTNFLTDLPGITEPALRLGVNEATWLGLTPAHTAELAGIITTAILTARPARELAARVAALRSRLPGDTCPPGIQELARQILRSVFGEISTGTAAGAP